MTTDNMDRSGVHASARCKGAWLLGTACGRCPKCLDEAPGVIRELLEREKTLIRKLRLLSTHLPGRLPKEAGDIDLTDNVKVVLFNEARHIMEEMGTGRP